MSNNPKNSEPKVPKVGAFVWRIREVHISGEHKDKEDSKVYENLMITVIKGLKVKRENWVKVNYDLIKYEKCRNIDNTFEDEGKFEEKRSCLFETELEAKVHLRGLLQKRDPNRKLNIVTEQVWKELLNAEEEESKKTEPNEFEQRRMLQIQANKDAEKLFLGEFLNVDEDNSNKTRKKPKKTEDAK